MRQGEDIFPFQTQLQLMIMLLRQPRTQRKGWDFIRAHWDFVQTRAPFLTPRLVEASRACCR